MSAECINEEGVLIMAFCSKCGTQMEDGAKFCPSCGTAVGGAAAKPVTEKVGNIRKCPACGAVVESFQGRCGSCGHEFRGVEVVDSVKTFFKKLEEYNRNNKVVLKHGILKRGLFGYLGFCGWGCLIAGGVSAGLSAALGSFGFEEVEEFEGLSVSFSLLVVILGLVLLAVNFFAKAKQEAPWTPQDQQKRELIESYPIPNSKEDLIEFAVLASGQVVPSRNKLQELASLKVKYQKLWNDVWSAKCQQIYVKAQMTFASDPQSLKIIKDVFDKKCISV
jgi:RNA polymerase subunit RPABC4/transcription elongation factor Spt4